MPWTSHRAYPSAIERLLLHSETVHALLLSGRRVESMRMRRLLLRAIHRAIERNPTDPRLWCLLGDHYKAASLSARCYRRALKVAPRDAEANSELAYFSACRGDRRSFKQHFDLTMATCRGDDIEDFVIFKAMDAARRAKDGARERRALMLGRKRFPGNSFFDA